MNEETAQTPLLPLPEFLPQPEFVSIDQGKQQRAYAYLSKSRVYMIPWLASLFVMLYVFTLSVAPSVISLVLSFSWLTFQPLAGWYPLRILAFYSLYAVGSSLCLVPFWLHMSFFLPRRYQMLEDTLSIWLRKLVIGRAMLSIRWLFNVQIFFFFIAIQPTIWWLWSALTLLVIDLLKNYFVPTLTISRFTNMSRLTDERIVQDLSALTQRGGMTIEGIYTIESRVKDATQRKWLPANAYLIGLGKSCRILLADGLLHHFSRTEIRSVLAHELGHHIHHDSEKKLLLRTCLWAGALWIYGLLYHIMAFVLLSYSTAALSIFVYLGAFYPQLVVTLLQRSYSRHREHCADEYALHITGDAVAFKNAMIRLANANNTLIKPFHGKNSSGTHPSILSRLQHADRFAAKLATAREHQ